MIFHHPAPLPSALTSGSRVRPVKMKQAFEKLGYDVFVVAGTGPERRTAIQTIKKLVHQGTVFDFVYSEPPTAPIAVVNHDVANLWLDVGFLRWCKQHAIPVGLFYRDVHWRFDIYKCKVPWLQRAISLPLFWFEWFNYQQVMNHLFIPSQEMAPALPTSWPKDNLSPLPPGCEITENIKTQTIHNKLNLFYVGGVTPPLYDLKPMLTVINTTSGTHLSLCCRQEEWLKVQNYYQPHLFNNIQIIHQYGKKLADYYLSADVFGLVWNHHPYLDFAMPVKVFEALGYGLPLITTAGTAVADFVQREGIGWVVANVSKFRELLVKLQRQPEEIANKRHQAEKVRHNHTWLQRAQTVANVMKQY